jgi:soluble lytic murein transglycosylase-like protein
MRGTVLLAAVALATGCASLRPASPEPSASLPMAPAAVSPLAGDVYDLDRDVLASSLALGTGVPARRYSVLGCIQSPEIDAWERRLEREARHWRRMLESRRGRGYYRAVRRIVEEEGLPPGLALLPAIESGYRPGARGPTGARGLWQFGASTARHYGLVVHGRRDDRTDVERSTRAALRLLRDLRARYGTWPLALAAYNAGEGRLQRAIQAEAGGTFWRLAEARRLPPVTRRYVPKFLALVRLVHDVRACPRLPSPMVATAE